MTVILMTDFIFPLTGHFSSILIFLGNVRSLHDLKKYILIMLTLVNICLYILLYLLLFCIFIFNFTLLEICTSLSLDFSTNILSEKLHLGQMDLIL